MTNRLSMLRPTQAVLGLTLLAVSCGWSATHAQETPGQQGEPPEATRQIKYSDFTKKRPPTSSGSTKPSSTGGDSAAWNSAPTYNRVKPAAPVRRRRRAPRVNNQTAARPPKPNPATPSRLAPEEVRDLGITLWRLRPARPDDTGPGFEVLQSGQMVVMTPERIAATSYVKLGDRVRVSIESPTDGYLYVIDREQYEDGSTGPPALVFPVTAIRDGDNRVFAGRLIDIPDSGDKSPFFTLTTKPRDGQPRPVGELITVLITPRPLQGITPGRLPVLLNPEQVAKWENDWEGDVVELLEMDGGAGQSWTMVEKLAGEATRSLTQFDPTPQTIYRVFAKPNGPLMVTVQMLYAEPATPRDGSPHTP
jgi:hypothetical protein